MVPSLLAGLVMMGATVPASAQTVHRPSFDEVANDPVSLAWVTALQDDGVVEGPVTANPERRSRIALPGAGP